MIGDLIEADCCDSFIKNNDGYLLRMPGGFRKIFCNDCMEYNLLSFKRSLNERAGICCSCESSTIALEVPHILKIKGSHREIYDFCFKCYDRFVGL